MNIRSHMNLHTDTIDSITEIMEYYYTNYGILLEHATF